MAKYCLDDVVTYTDAFLCFPDVSDDSRALNGLQVENSGRLTGIAAAVDACQATIDAAVRSGASLLLVHHGLFWGGLEPLVGRHGRRIKALMQGDVALYSAHLPLDRHPEVGNNWVLARRLEVTGIRPLEGMDPLIGVRGSVDVSRDALAARLGDIVGTSPRVIAAGPSRVRQVAVVTGAGASWLPHARAAGADTFITGEAPHHAFFDAEEWGMNLLLGGHYATETLGVKALAAHLGAKFNVGWEFVDHPTGL